MPSKVKILNAFMILTIICSCSWAKNEKNKSMPIDEQKALAIAEEKLVQTYGKNVLEQKPFKIYLENKIWKVSGTFHCPKGQNCKGGVAYVDISAEDGSVVSMMHEK